MAYTPINWDEVTPINPANLNKMDGEIDSNESRVDGNENNQMIQTQMEMAQLIVLTMLTMLTMLIG